MPFASARSRRPGRDALPVFGFDPREFARRHGGTTRLSIATGNTGGVYYPYGGGLARIISQSLPRVDATAEVTAASVDNLKLIQQGKADIAVFHQGSIWHTSVIALGGNHVSNDISVGLRTALVLVGPTFAEQLAVYLHLGTAFTWTWWILQWPVVFLLVAVLGGVFRYLVQR